MSKRTKVLFAINCLNVGGAPTVVYNQIKLLDHTRFAVSVLVLYDSKPANYLKAVADIIGAENIKHFQYRRRSKFDFRTVLAIVRYLRAQQFDVVYTHLFLANLVVRLAAVLARVPRIVSFEHSMYTDKRRWQIFADRILARCTAAVVVSTTEVYDFTVAQQRLRPDQCVVVRNPVLLPPVDAAIQSDLRATLDLPEAGVTFVTVGRFSKVKGHQVLLDAIAQCREELPADTRFLLVGHGPEEERLRAAIAESDLSSLVKLIHDPDRATQYLYLGDCFVLPSLREGQAMAAEEAVRAGLPVVASELPGMGNLIESQYNGVVFPPGDVHALARSITDIATAKIDLAPMAQAASDKAATFTSAQALITQLETVLMHHD